MSKKSYMSLLKEAISEFDTSDSVEVKGPMLDPILSWNGDGELPTNKDAASVLERYYFNETKEHKVSTLDEADYENDDGNPASGESMKNAKGAGTEQAGTSDAGSVKGGKAEKEKLIAKENDEIDDEDKEDKETVKEQDDMDDDTDDKEMEMENAIIEKLIAEMEDEDDDDKEELEETDMTYTGEGPKETMPKEKKSNDPEEDAQGAGTQQAGTGDAEGEIPPRKDLHDKMVKPKQYTDENAKIEAALAMLEAEMEDDMKDEDEDKELDVDKKMTKEAASAVPGGPSPKKRGEDWEDDESYYAEAFQIFKEAIDDMDDDDDDDIDDMDEVEENKKK